MPPSVQSSRFPSGAVIGLTVALTGMAATGAFAGAHPYLGWLALGCACVAAFFAWRLITRKRFETFLEITPEGALIRPRDGRPPRMIRWEILSDAAPDPEDPRALRFLLAGRVWTTRVPRNGPPARELATTLRAARPAHAGSASPDDPADALDAAFGFRPPPAATLVSWEKHPDGTAAWDIRIGATDLAGLRSRTLRTSAWYPLPPAMRFELGGARGRHGAPPGADYALGDTTGELTPVLIYSEHAGRLLCLLVRAML